MSDVFYIKISKEDELMSKDKEEKNNNLLMFIFGGIVVGLSFSSIIIIMMDILPDLYNLAIIIVVSLIIIGIISVFYLLKRDSLSDSLFGATPSSFNDIIISSVDDINKGDWRSLVDVRLREVVASFVAVRIRFSLIQLSMLLFAELVLIYTAVMIFNQTIILREQTEQLKKQGALLQSQSISSLIMARDVYDRRLNVLKSLNEKLERRINIYKHHNGINSTGFLDFINSLFIDICTEDNTNSFLKSFIKNDSILCKELTLEENRKKNILKDKDKISVIFNIYKASKEDELKALGKKDNEELAEAFRKLLDDLIRTGELEGVKSNNLYNIQLAINSIELYTTELVYNNTIAAEIMNDNKNYLKKVKEYIKEYNIDINTDKTMDSKGVLKNLFTKRQELMQDIHSKISVKILNIEQINNQLGKELNKVIININK